MKSEVRAFRLEAEHIEKLKQAGVNLTKLVQAAVAKAAKDKKCPYCGGIK